jgi:membrane protein implicated in regulation of membrane protease activity
MAISKNLQYILSGALVLYIVFFTRPAPTGVVNFLASPVAQLAALGVVVYLGACVSLLVAVVAALAVVLSIPVREYAGKEDDKTMSKKKGKEGVDEDKKKEKKEKEKNPTLDAAKDLSKLAAAAGGKKATAVSGDSMDKSPEPAGDKVAAGEMATKGSEKFSLMNAAPF